MDSDKTINVGPWTVIGTNSAHIAVKLITKIAADLVYKIREPSERFEITYQGKFYELIDRSIQNKKQDVAA